MYAIFDDESRVIALVPNEPTEEDMNFNDCQFYKVETLEELADLIYLDNYVRKPV